jgi:hypothetical protein
LAVCKSRGMRKDAEQVEAWLAERDAFLAGKEVK